jgi:hypothetical protein
MPWVAAHNVDHATPLHNFAFVANHFDAGTDLHVSTSVALLFLSTQFSVGNDR